MPRRTYWGALRTGTAGSQDESRCSAIQDEEGADFGGVVGGIEEGIFASGELIAAEESFAFAPSAAGDDGSDE